MRGSVNSQPGREVFNKKKLLLGSSKPHLGYHMPHGSRYSDDTDDPVMIASSSAAERGRTLALQVVSEAFEWLTRRAVDVGVLCACMTAPPQKRATSAAAIQRTALHADMPCKSCQLLFAEQPGRSRACTGWWPNGKEHLQVMLFCCCCWRCLLPAVQVVSPSVPGFREMSAALLGCPTAH